MRCRTARLVSVLLSAPLLALPAQAQTDAAQPAPPPPTTGGPVHTRPLDRLQEALTLQPHQLPLWQAYVRRLDDYTRQRYREKPLPAPETASATQQLAHLVNQQQNRLAALEDVEFAARELYAVLTPAQRKLADTQLMGTVPVFAAYGGGSVSAAAPAGPDGERPKGPPPGGMRQRPGGF